MECASRTNSDDRRPSLEPPVDSFDCNSLMSQCEREGTTASCFFPSFARAMIECERQCVASKEYTPATNDNRSILVHDSLSNRTHSTTLMMSDITVRRPHPISHRSAQQYRIEIETPSISLHGLCLYADLVDERTESKRMETRDGSSSILRKHSYVNGRRRTCRTSARVHPDVIHSIALQE